jgi:hypothetical protein
MRLALLAIAALLLIGCGSSSKSGGSGGRATDVPEFALKLRSQGVDNRYTYFEIERDGDFLYGGGRAGAQRTGEPIGKLTPEQRREVWRIIQANRLQDAPNEKADDDSRVRYELHINTGVLGSKLHTTDDKVPGVKELHDYLFELQAAERFKLPVMRR